MRRTAIFHLMTHGWLLAMLGMAIALALLAWSENREALERLAEMP